MQHLFGFFYPLISNEHVDLVNGLPRWHVLAINVAADDHLRDLRHGDIGDHWIWQFEWCG
jgi:hypothetical protein